MEWVTQILTYHGARLSWEVGPRAWKWFVSQDWWEWLAGWG